MIETKMVADFSFFLRTSWAPLGGLICQDKIKDIFYKKPLVSGAHLSAALSAELSAAHDLKMSAELSGAHILTMSAELSAAHFLVSAWMQNIDFGQF